MLVEKGKKLGKKTKMNMQTNDAFLKIKLLLGYVGYSNTINVQHNSIILEVLELYSKFRMYIKIQNILLCSIA